jgi:transcriptional regulator with XRE-family HTH domain
MQIVYRVDYPDVSKNVKRLREHWGWSQQTLAVNAGLSIGMVQKVERGIESVEIGTIERLSNALETRFESCLVNQ